jgi:CheY-like chemotaxis protein
MNNLLENTTILVIDDDPDMCDLLRTILGHEGANVLTANTVEDALDLCRREPPHLVVSDMRLGLSDGFAVIEAIREFNREYRGFTPAIALTGFVAPGEEQRAMAAGFNAYVHKPFEASELISIITSLLRRSPNLAA